MSFQTKYRLRVHIFLDVKQCHWVGDFWCFKGMWCTKFFWSTGTRTVQPHCIILHKTWLFSCTSVNTFVITWLPSVLSPHTPLPVGIKKTWNIFYTLMFRALCFALYLCLNHKHCIDIHTGWALAQTTTVTVNNLSSHAVCPAFLYDLSVWPTSDSIKTDIDGVQCCPNCSITLVVITD
jgi:hypothetical protein